MCVSRRAVQVGHVAAEAVLDALSMATLMRRSDQDVHGRSLSAGLEAQ